VIGTDCKLIGRSFLSQGDPGLPGRVPDNFVQGTPGDNGRPGFTGERGIDGEPGKPGFPYDVTVKNKITPFLKLSVYIITSIIVRRI
jgi:hypothetical protein